MTEIKKIITMDRTKTERINLNRSSLYFKVNINLFKKGQAYVCIEVGQI